MVVRGVGVSFFLRLTDELSVYSIGRIIARPMVKVN